MALFDIAMVDLTLFRGWIGYILVMHPWYGLKILTQKVFLSNQFLWLMSFKRFLWMIFVMFL